MPVLQIHKIEGAAACLVFSRSLDTQTLATTPCAWRIAFARNTKVVYRILISHYIDHEFATCIVIIYGIIVKFSWNKWGKIAELEVVFRPKNNFPLVWSCQLKEKQIKPFLIAFDSRLLNSMKDIVTVRIWQLFEHCARNGRVLLSDNFKLWCSVN